MNIALLAPFQNAISETFIHAHKKHLKGNIFFYYGADSFSRVEGQGHIVPESILYRLSARIKCYFTKYSIEEYYLYRSFKKNNIQLILGEYGTSGTRILALSKKMGLPLIVHFHGYDAYVKNVLKQEENLYREMFDYAYKVIVVSKDMHRQLLYLGCSPDKIVLNYYGPSDDFFMVDHKIHQKNFIALGRFVEKKAPYYLILSFKILLEQFPDAKLIIGGEGPLLESCRNITRALNIETSVTLPGKMTKEDFMGCLQTAVAFIQHSITANDGDSEGTPVALLEAMAAGVAVVSTKHAGISDVVVENETGYLVEEHSINSMAEKMQVLLSDLSLAEHMGAKGRERIQNSFTMEKHIHILNDIISKVA